MLLKTSNTIQNTAAEYLDHNLSELKAAIESKDITDSKKGEMCELVSILSDLCRHYVRDINDITNRNNPDIVQPTEEVKQNRHHCDMIDKLRFIKLLSSL